MARQSESDHVDRFLNATDVEPDGTFQVAVEAIAEAADESPELQATIGAVLDWAAKPDPAVQADLHAPEAAGADGGEVIISPDIDLLLSVGHLRAQAALAKGGGANKLRQQLKHSDQVQRKVSRELEKLEPDFVGKLLQQTRERSQHDPRFAAAIAQSNQYLREVGPNLPNLPHQRNPDRSLMSSAQAFSCTLWGSNTGVDWGCVIVAAVIVTVIILAK